MRERCRSAQARSATLGALLAWLGGAASGGSAAAELPVPCVAGSCGASVPGFVSSGQAGATVSGNTLNVQQTTARAVLNWSSFNVSEDGRVVFQQPDAASIALNRIFQDSPSRILGTVDANGQIYLINQNGMVFGRTARVNAAGLVASSLNLSDAAFNAGLLAPELLQNRRAALESDGRASVLDSAGQPVLGADGKPLTVGVTVEQGAALVAKSGGRVLLAGQRVDNAGRIEAPDGQVVLAAGEKVYLQASGDPALRGLLVEVDGGGDAFNRLSGELRTPRGNVTMVGLAVNQDGRVSATTSVAANGSVRLLARDSVRFDTVSAGVALTATRTGRVESGASSVIDILPEAADPATAVDEQAQLMSRIEMFGRQVVMRGGARITAPGGDLRATAARDATANLAADAESRIRIETDARIDLKGSSVDLPVTRNLVEVELRANELRDSPLQRDGALRGKKVIVDARVGTPLADVSGALAAIPRGVAERTSAGGTATFSSQGDVVVASGVTVDVSGGQVNYTPGIVQTTQLVGADGRIVDIGQADPNRTYVGLINPTSELKYDRWGVVQAIQGPAIGRADPGYLEGRPAGTLQFVAPTLVLNGDFRGSAVTGPLQRDPARQPAGGRFVIGIPDGQGLVTPDYFSPSVNIVRRPPNLVVGGDSPLPGPRTLDLAVDFLDYGGFTRTEIYSNGVVTLAEDNPLTLAAGSSLRINAQRVQFDAGITAPGGSIRATAEVTAGLAGSTPPRYGVVVADGVGFDVRGGWTNDALAGEPTQFVQSPAGIFRNGGTVELAVAPLAANGELAIGSNVSFLASGGAWRQASGTVLDGRGGRIALRAGPLNTEVSLGSNVSLQAFGVGTASGGSLLLEAARIEVQRGTRWADAQAFDPLDPAARFFTLGTALFSDHGFSSIELVATGARPEGGDDTFVVRRGASVEASARALELDATIRDRPTGGPVAAFSRIVELPEYRRQPFTLSLRADPREFDRANLVGRLSLEAGSTIRTDPRATIQISSIGRILLGGSILAPAGIVRASLGVPSAGYDAGFDPTIAIELQSGALIDVAGRSLVQPSDTGLQRGSVLAGGTISLVGSRGSLRLDAGSRLDVSGAAAPLDLATPDGRGYERRVVASSAGEIELRATESILVQGELRAAAGQGETGTAAGGSLTLGLFRLRGLGDPRFESTYPSNPRVVRLVPDAFGAGTSFPNGLAVLDSSRIARSGIDALRIESSGAIELDAGLDLKLARQIILDAPEFEVLRGGAATVSAPFVSIGNSQPANLSPGATPGTAQLDVTAGLLELFGHSTLQRIRSATLAADDVRMRGVEASGRSTGSFAIAGNLAFQAGRLYPTTLSEFTIMAAGGGDERLRIDQRGAPGAVPLSVAGALRFSARDIVQAGTVLAPFGSLAFAASNALEFASGSVSSVSAGGQSLLFGTVQGDAWQYDIGGQLREITTTPTRVIAASSDTLTLAAGSTLDLRGGGDLFSYEWLPGTGGSVDVLAAGRTPGLYAIVPSLRGQFAPFDPQEFAGSGLRPGDSLVIASGSSLAAGTYPLLPARYALLPGAYLVNAVAGVVDPTPGSLQRLPDGSAVVAGYRVFTGTGLGETRYSGYALRPGSEARRLANYEDRSGTAFLAARAQRLDLPVGNLPADAGTLDLEVRRALDARGDVLTAAAAGGSAAQISLSAPRLEIVASGAAASTTAVQVATSVLDRWNPGRLLLGGRRSGASGNAIDVVAQDVTVRAGAQLRFDEIVMAALGSLRVEQDARVASRATTPLPNTAAKVELVAGPGTQGAAVLAVSDLADYTVSRSAASAAPAPASVRLDAGAELSSARLLLVDAPGGATFDGTLSGAGAIWNLGSRRIRFGAADGSPAMQLTPAVAASLGGAATLRLTADTIEFGGALQLGASDLSSPQALQALQLDTAEVLNRSGADVALNARAIALRGRAGSTATPQAGTGTFSLSAEELAIGAGSLRIGGFGATVFDATRTLDATGDADVVVAGPLDLRAARVGASAGATAAIRSDSLLRVASSAATLPLPRAQFGGGLTLAGRDVEVSGAIVAPSGRVSLEASRDVRLLDGAEVDVAGAALTVADRTVGSHGGFVGIDAGGDILVSQGATLRLDGAGDSDAGRLQVRGRGALQFDGAASALAALDTARGGSVAIDVGRLVDFAALNTRLESGGFDDSRHVAVASGDLVLAAGERLSASDVSLSADSGAVRIDGTVTGLDGFGRPEIGLFGATGVTLGATGSLVADASGAAGRGGRILLGTASGSLDLAPGSTVSARGEAEAGRLRLRAPATTSDLAVTRLASRFSGLGEIMLEPVSAFDVAAAPSAATLDGYRAAVASYVTRATPIIGTRLSLSPGSPSLVVEPGIDLRRSGDLTLPALDLVGWRFNGRPAAINVRATGNVTVSGTWSDGVRTVGTGTAARLDLQADRSSTLRVASGARLGSANPLAVDTAATSDITIARGVVVRTGTGDLEFAAARDLVFAGTGSSVYTMGVPGAATQVIPQPMGASVAFPVGGGQLSIAAGRDVLGFAVSQSVTNWQPRQGRLGDAASSATQWGVDLRNFGWNAGTLGGGDLSVAAGRDVRELSAAAADAAIESRPEVLTRFSGGTVDLVAGRDLSSLMVHSSAGRNRLRAEGALGRSRTVGGEALGSLFSMQGGSLDLVARRGLAIETVLNSSLLPQPGALPTAVSFFLTYGDEARLRAQTASGELALDINASRLAAFLTQAVVGSSVPEALAVLPPNVSLTSFGGDVRLLGTSIFAPADRGQLEILAGRDVRSPAGMSLTMSDGSATAVPTPLRPSAGSADAVAQLGRRAASARHAGDSVPVLISAGRDISGGFFGLSKAARVIAERDIVDLSVLGQNVNLADLTLVSAGRDFRYTRSALTGRIEIGGPGRVDVIAGRDVDLGFSRGLTTIGRLANPTLPSATGADLTVVAGLAQALDATAFVDKVVAATKEGRDALVAFVADATGRAALAFDAASTVFKGLSADLQRPFLLARFFGELVASGREANRDPDAGFDRGYAAIDTLWSGSRDPLGGSSAGPWAGDLTMAFSRIYTLDGGTISLVVPGGLLNVGIANPPSNLPVVRRPADLGIVAQQQGDVRIFTRDDVLVNQSRVFTLRGGDIVIWSTTGDIDAGRGAKTAISAPPPAVLVDAAGNVSLDFAGAVAGSGIRAIVTDDAIEPGDVDLIAPTGIVNAGDAGIGSAGNLNVAAQQVVGLDNIQVGGASTGVPAETSNLGASLSGVSSVSSAAASASSGGVGDAKPRDPSPAPLADSALGWLDVFVEGFGDEVCKPNDAECLERQRKKP